jgi:hypothetical protein
MPFGSGVVRRRAQQKRDWLLPSKKHPWMPSGSVTREDRDAELDEVLREIGNELLEHEVPERLLRVVRAAAAAAEQAKEEKQTKRSRKPT